MANKTEIVDAIAKKKNLTKTAVSDVIAGLHDYIMESVAQDHSVTFVGFGTYTSATRESRTGRNPQTGKPMFIPKTKVVKFKAGKKFKELLRDPQLD